jgi:hypothetical protein
MNGFRWIVTVFLLMGVGGQTVLGQQIKLTPAKVADSIDACVSFLRSQQVKNGARAGSWPGHEDLYGCGQTCLVTLALLSAGREVKSPEVNKALSFIRGTKPQKTYEAALKLMVLCLAEPNKDKGQIEEVKDWIVKAQAANGGWGYGQDVGDSDESNSQFAVLALWEASKLGVTIPQDCFIKSKTYWLNQRRGEGWGYRQDKTIGSMTCAGIASMLILQDVDDGADAGVRGNNIQCCGGGQEFDLDRPMKWLTDNFSVAHNPNHIAYTMYYLYALERVGRLTGQRFIGDHDWYREGAEYLLGNQAQSVGGSFRGGPSESDTITASSMALLFLSKGKRQVVIGHLQFGDPRSNDSNQHRRSIQNLTGQIEKVWKRELAWQSIQLEKATLESMLETPVLFISGTREFTFTAAQRKLIKDYAEQTGFIFAEACNGDGCDGQGFDKSFRREMELIFDKPLQKLPPSHPIWTAEAKVDPNALPKDFWLYGLDACCRTSVVYSPVSLSCRWELARPWGNFNKRPAAVEGDIQNAVKIGVNVAAYATGRELKEKLDEVRVIQPQSNRQSLTRGSLTIAKIAHSGGADDTPKAVSNLLEMFRNEVRTPAEYKTPMVSLVSEEVEKYPILYIHGRNKFAFADEERRGLKRHFENGGFVIGDAICASKDFADSVRREFSQSLPDSFWRKIDPKHPIMRQNGPVGFDLGNVVLIDPSASGADLKQSRREGPADLDALEWNGRIVMLFSPNDMSCAMESKHSMQCRGYVRDDSFRIGINMVLFALSE